MPTQQMTHNGSVPPMTTLLSHGWSTSLFLFWIAAAAAWTGTTTAFTVGSLSSSVSSSASVYDPLLGTGSHRRRQLVTIGTNRENYGNHGMDQAASSTTALRSTAAVESTSSASSDAEAQSSSSVGTSPADNNNNNNNSASPQTQQLSSPSQSSSSTPSQLHTTLSALLSHTAHASRDDAVRAAVKAHELWRTEGQPHDAAALHLVLRLWARTTQILAELHTAQARPTTPKASGGDSTGNSNPDNAIPQLLQSVDVSNVGIYTARDAAQQASDILQAHLDAMARYSNGNTSDVDDGVDDVDDNNVDATTIATTTTPPTVDTTCFNAVLDAWSKSRDRSAPDQVDAWFDKVAVQPKTAPLRSNTSKQPPIKFCRPDSTTYNAVVDTYAYSRRHDRLDVLTELLATMAATPHIHASVRTKNSVLAAHSKVGLEVPEQRGTLAQAAYGILWGMKEAYGETKSGADQPDVVTYTTVMECFARCGTVQSAEKAEELFVELQDLYKSTSNDRFRPSCYTYTTLIKAWTRSGAHKSPERGEELLNELLESTDGVQANAMAFTAAIQSWARSRDVRKAVKSLELLKRMRAILASGENTALQRNLMCYNTVIDACGRTRGTAEQQTAALKIAFAVLKTIELDFPQGPNHVTFATLLTSISFLMPAGNERNTIATKVFEKAVARAQVDVTVIQSLQKTCDATVQQELLGGHLQPKGRQGNFDYNRIPVAWNRNVRK